LEGPHFGWSRTSRSTARRTIDVFRLHSFLLLSRFPRPYPRAFFPPPRPKALHSMAPRLCVSWQRDPGSSFLPLRNFCTWSASLLHGWVTFPRLFYVSLLSLLVFYEPEIKEILYYTSEDQFPRQQNVCSYPLVLADDLPPILLPLRSPLLCVRILGFKQRVCRLDRDAALFSLPCFTCLSSPFFLCTPVWAFPPQIRWGLLYEFFFFPCFFFFFFSCNDYPQPPGSSTGSLVASCRAQFYFPPSTLVRLKIVAFFLGFVTIVFPPPLKHQRFRVWPPCVILL